MIEEKIQEIDELVKTELNLTLSESSKIGLKCDLTLLGKIPTTPKNVVQLLRLYQLPHYERNSQLNYITERLNKHKINFYFPKDPVLAQYGLMCVDLPRVQEKLVTVYKRNKKILSLSEKNFCKLSVFEQLQYVLNHEYFYLPNTNMGYIKALLDDIEILCHYLPEIKQVWN